MEDRMFAAAEYYHLYNRGVRKSTIFHDARDYARFLFLLLACQLDEPISNPAFYVNKLLKQKSLELDTQSGKKPFSLLAFALMPNHFHLMIYENEGGSTSRYMQRVLGGYSNYYNARYKTSGHVFQGKFQGVHINKESQFYYASAYIHRNPCELRAWSRKPEHYMWSSYQDYVFENRWGDHLDTKTILSYFKNPSAYYNYVKGSGAKDKNYKTSKVL
jgi:putative transposase